MPDPINPFTDPSAPGQSPGQTVAPGAQQPAAPAGPPPPAPPPAPLTTPSLPPSDQDYSFITNPPAPPKKSLIGSLPGSESVVGRVGLVSGLVVAVLILFMIVRAILSGGGLDSSPFLSVAQDQQEMLHLVANATGGDNNLSGSDENFAATLKASVTSSQSQLIAYLIKNKVKVKPKELGLKISATTDQQLLTAKASGTYDQTFKDVMSAQLNTYGNDLVKAYRQTKGPKGRALLNDSYHQAQLLAIQLKSGQ